MNVYEIIGATVMFVFAIGASALCVAILIHEVSRARQRRDDLVESATRVALGQRLASSAWWFEPHTQLVLHEIAQDLLMGRWWNEDQIREKCRAAKKEGV